MDVSNFRQPYGLQQREKPIPYRHETSFIWEKWTALFQQNNLPKTLYLYNNNLAGWLELSSDKKFFKNIIRKIIQSLVLSEKNICKGYNKPIQITGNGSVECSWSK